MLMLHILDMRSLDMLISNNVMLVLLRKLLLPDYPLHIRFHLDIVNVALEKVLAQYKDYWICNFDNLAQDCSSDGH